MSDGDDPREPSRTGLDPRLFRPEAIDPATLAFNRRIEQVERAWPPVWTQSPQAAREAREIWPPLQLVESAESRTIEGQGGALGIRIFRSTDPVGLLLHFHPGGWVLGAAHHHDGRLARLAAETRLTVVSLDYRLAPEHPHPAAPDDAEAAARWLIERGPAELGAPARFAIGGESAGAQLAVLALARLRDGEGATPFEAAVLSYGTFDLSASPSVRLWGERRLSFDARTFTWFVDHYVEAERRRDPDVSPLHADLAGLPAALFTVGTLDPVLDDTLFMHARWIAAANPADLAVYPGGVHGFIEYRFPLAELANERIHRFLRERLGDFPP